MIHFYTGKGGVGKTHLSLAHASTAQKPLWIHFSSELPKDVEQFVSDHHIEAQSFEFYKTLEEYISRKLKNKLLAKWLFSSNFFTALIDVVPGIKNVATMGKLEDLYTENSDREIFVDAPSFGHSHEIFSSLKRFQEIFLSGIFFKDLIKLRNFSVNKEVFNIYLVTIPQGLSVNETLEFKSLFIEEGLSPQVLLNQEVDIEKDLAPKLLKKKIENEQESVKPLGLVKIRVPLILAKDLTLRILKISEYFVKGTK